MKNNYLYLQKRKEKLIKQILLKSVRVGLTLNKSDSIHKEKFINLPYRYILLPFIPKKQRTTIITTLYSSKE